MENVALSKEEAEYFQTGGETLPPVVEAPQSDTPAIADAPVDDSTNQESQSRDEKTGKFVPHQALHQEREERKKAQAEVTTLRERQAILEDRWNTLLKVQEKPAEEKGPPNPDEDIFGAIKWQQEQILKDREERQNASKAAEERSQQERSEQQAKDYWNSSLKEYTAQEPDFTNVASWLIKQRHDYWSAFAGVDPRMADERNRDQQIDREVMAVIDAARQSGQNPAAILHGMAKQWGYAGAQEQSNPNQAAMDNLSKLEKAQQASRTLSASGGKSPGDNMTAEGIANMSNEEFTRFMSDPANERILRNVMGG